MRPTTRVSQRNVPDNPAIVSLRQYARETGTEEFRRLRRWESNLPRDPSGTAGYATDVHVEIAYTHSALTPLGIHQLCQASRRGIVRVHMDGHVEVRSSPSWFSAYSRRLGVE